MIAEPDRRTLALSACVVDLATGAVGRQPEVEALTTRELDLLRFLVAHQDRVVSRDQILREVFGYADEAVSRACDNTVRRLRAKVEGDPARPDHLLTVHGTGYRLVLGAAPVVAELPVEREVVALGPIRVDLDRRRVLRPDGDVGLTESETTLLDLLLRADGRVVERRTLVRAAWSDRAAVGPRFLDSAMSTLRTKVEPDPAEPRFLHTARGTGYRLERPPERGADPDLVGRDPLVAAGLEAIDAVRWVLLVGPPGVGKSRLARHLAARVDRSVVWVDGTTVRSVAEAAAAVAVAMREDVGADPIEGVRAALSRRRRILVVLDNLEHAPAVFASLLSSLTGSAAFRSDAKWLGTSRIRLGVPEERVIEVEPLSTDDAAALFVRRVRAASPTSPLDPARPEVRALVDRLDRLPLAIELAAPRLRVLSLEQLATRLDLDLLVRTTAPDPRHRSLRVALEASLEALTELELRALVQVSLFQQGLFVDDAEGLFGDDAIDLLQTLRDHSLLHRVPDDTGSRFVTWHAVRELLRADQDPAAVQAHCAWLGRRGTLESDLTPAEAARHRAYVDDDVAATHLAIAIGAPLLAGRCAMAALWTLGRRGPLGAGLALADSVLRMPLPPEERSAVLVWRGTLLLQARRGVDAEPPLTEALRIGAEHDLPMVEMVAAAALGDVAANTGDAPAVRRWHERAALAADRSGHHGRAAYHRGELALSDGDHRLAAASMEEALRSLRSASTRALVHQRLATLRGVEPDQARRHLEQACAILRENGTYVGLRAIVQDSIQLAHVAGDHQAESDWAELGLEVAAAAPRPGLDAYTHALRARGRLWTGRVDEAAADLDQAEGLAAGEDPQVRALVADIRAQWCAATGDLAGAGAHGARAAAWFVEAHQDGAAAYAERHLAVAEAVGDREVWLARSLQAHPASPWGTELRWARERLLAT
ncbi:MAG: winged helix-turn-helix domain-containing protein [Myxococcota bacterium]